MMINVIGVVVLSAAFGLPATASVEAAAEPQQFRGEGSSSFGFALDYARRDAQDKATEAGYTRAECVEIEVWDWYWDAWVVIECVHPE